MKKFLIMITLLYVLFSATSIYSKDEFLPGSIKIMPASGSSEISLKNYVEKINRKLAHKVKCLLFIFWDYTIFDESFLNNTTEIHFEYGKTVALIWASYVRKYGIYLMYITGDKHRVRWIAEHFLYRYTPFVIYDIRGEINDFFNIRFIPSIWIIRYQKKRFRVIKRISYPPDGKKILLTCGINLNKVLKK